MGKEIEYIEYNLKQVSPIQRTELGHELEERGAVASLLEGCNFGRRAESNKVKDDLFYAEWEPNHSAGVHRYLIAVCGDALYVGWFPERGEKPTLKGVFHRKSEVVQFLHRTHNSKCKCPTLHALCGNICGVSFEREENLTRVFYNGGSFWTRSIYGTPTKLVYEDDGEGPTMTNPLHPWYMFKGAEGYVELYEGTLFYYPNGQIRLVPIGEEIFRGFRDVTVVQGDLVAYNVRISESGLRGATHLADNANVGRHYLRANKECLVPSSEIEGYEYYVKELGGIVVLEDCEITVSHPEHGEHGYIALKGEVLAPLPGVSRPYDFDTSGSD